VVLETCPKCKGVGHLPEAVVKHDNVTYIVNCKHCDGTGRVDWIEMVIGKNNGASGISGRVYVTGVSGKEK